MSNLLLLAGNGDVNGNEIYPEQELALPRFSQHDIDIDNIESGSSTPFVSAPSTPQHQHVHEVDEHAAAPGYFFFSAPTSPMHFLLLSHAAHTTHNSNNVMPSSADSPSFEFQLSSSFGSVSMTSADDLFFNGHIRPMIISHNDSEYSYSHAQGTDDIKCSYSHRKARSMSLLHSFYHWRQPIPKNVDNQTNNKSMETMASSTSRSSSSSSSSSGGSSTKWVFLKDLINRSKNNNDASFSPTKDHNNKSPQAQASSPSSSKKNKSQSNKKTKNTQSPAASGVWKWKPSAHELHYTANRAQAEELKKKTLLPYREGAGLLGCLGFTSKTYGAFTTNLNPASSRI